jgi:DNA repair protein RadB
MTRFSLGCTPLDQLLGGGLESGIITKIYGEAATGKTNICLQAAREFAASEGTVAYIDTEGVSLERFHQICGSKATCDSYLKHIHFFKPLSFEEQAETIYKISKRKDIGMIIVDTMNLFYRLHLDRDKDETMRSFSRQVATLLTTARQKNLYIIITEQVYTDKTGEIRPFATRETEHLAKTIIRLEKEPNSRRIATIIRHRSEPEGKTTHFTITHTGIQ